MSFVYVLRLIGNRYYIGKTINVVKRISAHFNGSGSKWTKLHQPVEVMEVFKNCNGFDEDYFTKQYMAKYGVENVRGGSYCGITLNTNELNVLRKEFDTALDRCFVCGEVGHMSIYCPNRRIMTRSANKSKSPIIIPKYIPPDNDTTNNTIKDDIKKDLFVFDKDIGYKLMEKEIIEVENKLNNNTNVPKKGSFAYKKKRRERRKTSNTTSNTTSVPKSANNNIAGKKKVVTKDKQKAKVDPKNKLMEDIENKLKLVMKEHPGHEKVDFCIICFQLGHKPLEGQCPIYDYIYSPNPPI